MTSLSARSQIIEKEVLPILEKMSEAELQKAAPAVLAEIYKHDLYSFTKNCLGYNLLVPHVHREMTDILTQLTKPDGIERALIVMPRGTFKSTVCTVALPLWILARDPNARILIDSEVYENAAKYLREIVSHVRNPFFIWIFGDWLGKNSFAREGEFQTSMRTKVHKEASITCSGIGAQKTGQHYDWIISDDIASISNTQTKDQREKVHNHYRLYTSLAEPRTGRIVVVGTRYHESDLIGFVLAALGLNARDIVN